MATTIQWIDNSSIETAHRIYKSSTYFTKDNLPAVLVELGPDVTEYVDSAGVDGENWYIVSAVLNDYEVFSEPFIAGLSTAYIHDIFNDGSAVATYNFDGDATDLGGNTSINLTGFNYTTGLINQSVDCGSVSSGTFTFTGLDSFAVGSNGFSVSTWINKPASISNGYILVHSTGISNDQNILMRIFNDKMNVFAGSVSLDSSLTLNNNQWYHCVVIYDASSDQASIYIDGVLDSTLTMTFSTTASLYFSSYSGGNYRYNGRLDQLRFFNRPLSQSEIDDLYVEGVSYQ